MYKVKNVLEKWKGSVTKRFYPKIPTSSELDLPPDCLLQIVLLVQVSDIPKVAAVSKQFRKVCEHQILLSARFLYKFGQDYWGEFVGDHPYILVPEENNFFNLPTPARILATSDKAQWNMYGENIKKDVIYLYGLANIHGWPYVYQKYLKLAEVWQMPCNSALLVCGLANSGKSTVLSLIEQDPKHKVKEKLLSFHKLQIIRVEVDAIKGTESYVPNEVWDINFCEIEKPRNWYPQFRGSSSKYLYLIYVVDSYEFATNTEYQSTLYKEFHGMLGEAATSTYTSLGLVISKRDLNGAASVTNILKFLKLCPAQIHPDRNGCPYYAGPVTIGVFAPNCLTNATQGMTQLLKFLLSQPSLRPHWRIEDVPYSNSDLLLAKLIDWDESKIDYYYLSDLKTKY